MTATEAGQPPPLSAEELARRRSRAAIAVAVLWFMRLGIVAMLAVVLSFFFVRYHKSDEQVDLIRYVEVDLPILDRVEAPLVDRLESLLDEKRRPPSEVRQELADELMPGLVRLRKLSDSPLNAARTPPVKALAAEYRDTVEALIAACRAALRVIDDPKLDAREGLHQVHSALRSAAEKSRTWRQHVAATRDVLHLAPPQKP